MNIRHLSAVLVASVFVSVAGLGCHLISLDDLNAYCADGGNAAVCSNLDAAAPVFTDGGCNCDAAVVTSDAGSDTEVATTVDAMTDAGSGAATVDTDASIGCGCPVADASADANDAAVVTDAANDAGSDASTVDASDAMADASPDASDAAVLDAAPDALSDAGLNADGSGIFRLVVNPGGGNHDFTAYVWSLTGRSGEPQWATPVYKATASPTLEIVAKAYPGSTFELNGYWDPPSSSNQWVHQFCDPYSYAIATNLSATWQGMPVTVTGVSNGPGIGCNVRVTMPTN